MNNGILSKEDILCMQYSRMKSSQIMNPNLAPEEFPTPPDEVCCWPGRRGGAPSGRNLLAKAHKNAEFVLGMPELLHIEH